MQTFNPRNLTFRTWRSIYLNIKEASWPIALRFGDSHLEHFQHFHVRLHEENYYPIGNMGFLLVTGSADQLVCRCKRKWWICGHEKFTNAALIRSWLNYPDYTCYSFHSLLENNMAHVTVDWNPLGKVFYR